MIIRETGRENKADTAKYLQSNGVLKNKLGLTTWEELHEAERKITTLKLALLYEKPVTGNFDAKHYLQIHKFLFENIYEWAGEIRSTDIHKRIPFCPSRNIYSQLEETLQGANRKISYINSKDDLLNFIVPLYSTLDFIHPFREGNGRTLREYIRQYMKVICKLQNLPDYYLDFGDIKDRNKYIDAVVLADETLEYGPLYDLFSEILREKNISDKIDKNMTN